MSYRKRIQAAAAGSLVVHFVILISLDYSPAEGAISSVAKPEPLVLALNPPEPERVLRVIEGGTPADRPLEPSDLISDRDTMAQDQADVDGERPQPFFEEGDEFDELAQSEPMMPTPPSPSPAVSPAMAPAWTPETDGDEGLPLEQVDAVGLRVAEWKEERPELEGLDPKEEELAAPFDVAQAPDIPRPQVEDPGVVRGRMDGGVDSKGFMSFEAHRHVFGGYMIEVRRRVERGWRAALQMKYSGTTPTAAVIECAISPEGTLVYVTVVEPGGSASYASLCKEAIRRSGPFPPFPFEIPAVYRSRNLEIRWKFSFL